MNCAPFLEINKLLTTDVTVALKCPNKGFAQRLLEIETVEKQ